MARVYKFLPSKWALDAIKNQHIKISRICDLTDPFDLLPYDFTDKERPDAQIHARTELLSGRGIGLLCFSFKWSNPVLWAHYADKHNGICLGFDLPDDVADKVRYVKKRERLPSDWNEDEETALQWAKKLLFTKFHGWEYEAECESLSVWIQKKKMKMATISKTSKRRWCFVRSSWAVSISWTQPVSLNRCWSPTMRRSECSEPGLQMNLST